MPVVIIVGLLLVIVYKTWHLRVSMQLVQQPRAESKAIPRRSPES